MTDPLTIVIAPDSFKGSATATQIAAAIGDGWSSVRPGDTIVLAPMADGGEGTLDAFEVAVPGAVRMPVTVQGPDNRPVDASWLLLPATSDHPGGVGVVELAETSGITLLDRLSPLDAHTLGFGQAIAAALDHGVSRLLLAIGGSSSTDGGVGALTALGAVFTDATNRPVRLGNRGLGTLAKVDLSGLRPLPPFGAGILSDVTNPLLGPLGAASVFGPQKGANPEQVVGLESNLVRLERLMRLGRVASVERVTSADRVMRAGARADAPGMGARVHAAGAGAAGGTGYGLLAWGAALAPGATAVGDALGLPGLLGRADLVITGEGRFDSQSAAGKVASYVAHLAADAGIRSMLVAGAIDAPPDAFEAAASLTELAGGSTAAIADPLTWARAAGAALAARG